MIGRFSRITHGSAVCITVKIVEFIIIYVFCLFPCFFFGENYKTDGFIL